MSELNVRRTSLPSLAGFRPCLSLVPTVLLLWVVWPSLLHAALLGHSLTTPSLAPEDIHNLIGAEFDGNNVGGSGINAAGGPNNGAANDGTTYVAGNRPAQGQTFLTGTNASGYDLTSISFRVVGYSNNVAGGTNNVSWNLADVGFFRVRILDIRNGTNSVPRSFQYARSGAPGNPGAGNSSNGPGPWLTFVLDYAVHLEPGSTYGFDIAPANGPIYFEWLGIRDDAPNGNLYTNGSAYVPGTGYFEITPLAGDRVFHLSLTASASPPRFDHPGALHSEADFFRMSNKVAAAAQPWKASYDMLVGSKYAQTSWNPAPVQYINRGGSNPNNYTRSQEDAAAIYQLALRWRITGNVAYANRAVYIMNAWANTLFGVTGDSNQSLGSGICGAQFACAAEMLSTYPGWAVPDRQKFKDMMMRAFYTSNDDFLWRHHDNCSTHYRLNWDTASMVSMLATGVLCDNKAVFDQALGYFFNGDMNGNIHNAIWFIHADGLGQGEEAGRDQGHNNGGLNFLSRFCQVAWNQGVDLFGYDNNRVLRGLEYIAKYNLGYDVSYVPHRTCDMTYTEGSVSSAGRGALDPMFELLYNHYVKIRGLAAPYCQQAAERMRPEGGPNTSAHPSQVDWFGFGSLTYTRDSFPGDIPPSGLTARLRGSQVLLNWWGSAYATNYVIKRANARGGPYTQLATIPASASRMYYDTNFADGSTWHYVVSSLTPAGETANSPGTSITMGTRLLSYLKFNETTGTIAADSSSNGLPAVLFNGATLAGGKYGNALNLAAANGQYASMPENLTRKLSDFTVSAWVNLTSLSTWMRIWDFGDGTPLAWKYVTPTRYLYLSPRGGSGVVRFAITGSHYNLEQGISGTSALPVGSWAHVAVSLSGNTGILYVNGLAVGTNDNIYMSPDQLGATDQNWLGRSQFLDPYLDGRIDDFRIYSGALTAGQISALHAAVVATSAPAAPQSLKAAAVSSDRIEVTWDESAGATGYAVKRSTTSGGPYATIASGLTGTNFSDTGLSPAATFSYVVAAENDGGQGANSTEVSATTLMPPDSPTGLTANMTGPHQASLNWNPVPGADSYNLYYSTVSSGPFALLESLIASTSLTRVVGSGMTYYFVVTSANANGESSPSSSASLLTTPPAPANLVALSGPRTINLSWQAARSATSYEVRRATTSGGPYSAVASVSSNTLVYVDANVTAGQTWHYVVSAINASGQGPSSMEVSAVVRTTLTAWLTFDETTGTAALDATGNGWNGALLNNATWVTGFSSNAVGLSSNSSAYVALPAGVMSNFSDFTIATWVYQSNASAWARIFDLGTGQTANMFLTPRNGANGFLRFAITTSGGSGEQQINTTTVLPVNAWKHVAVTLEGTVGILYVDGQPVGTNAAMTLQPSSLGKTTQNYIGRSQYPDPYFDGCMDDFRIFSGALSAGEVTTLVTPLAVPTDLSALGLNDTSVSLAWAGVPRATSYNVFRSQVVNGPYALATNVTGTACIDSGLATGRTYFYLVTAANAAGESDRSQPVSVRPLASTAVELSIASLGDQIRITWPETHIGWILQTQTNPPGAGLGPSWFEMASSSNLNYWTLLPASTDGSAFFRLVRP